MLFKDVEIGAKFVDREDGETWIKLRDYHDDDNASAKLANEDGYDDFEPDEQVDLAL